MITSCAVRDGQTGVYRRGQVYAGGDSTSFAGPTVVADGRDVAPGVRTVLVLPPSTPPSLLMELLAAGYAVQLRRDNPLEER